MFTVKNKIFYLSARVVYDFNVVALSSPCANQHIHLIIPGLTRYLFIVSYKWCGSYWRAALKRGRRLFKSKRNSYETSKLCNFLFPNDYNFISVFYLVDID